MALWQNIPFFCILLSLASSAFTAVLPKKHARRTVLIVISAVVVMSAVLVGYMIPYGQSYTYMMGHYPAPWGNEIRVGILEAVVALVFSLIMLLGLRLLHLPL